VERTTERLPFAESRALTIGIELEVQIVNTRDYNLTRGASDLLGALKDGAPYPGEIKPEVTESMVELASSIHTGHAGLLAELVAMRDVVVAAAQRLNVGIAGGGAHPFQNWSDRRIYDTERFNQVAHEYGYLAKQFTVFGQHIHVGCASGDDAVYLTHMLSRYVPHFIALSASSPFHQGEDTLFDSSRLSIVSAFPLSGRIPLVRDWAQFEAYFAKHLERDLEDLRYRCHETSEEAHGRIDERSYFLTRLPRDFALEQEWPWIKAIGYALRVTRHADGRETDETRFDILSRYLSGKRFSEAVRGHWGIESMHWVLDVNFREDDSRTRERTLGNNLSWLRRFAVTVLKRHPDKDSLRGKMISCSLNTDYLTEVLSLQSL